MVRYKSMTIEQICNQISYLCDIYAQRTLYLFKPTRSSFISITFPLKREQNKVSNVTTVDLFV